MEQKINLYGREWKCLDVPFIPNVEEDWKVCEFEGNVLWMNNYSGYMVLVREGKPNLLCYI